MGVNGISAKQLQDTKKKAGQSNGAPVEEFEWLRQEQAAVQAAGKIAVSAINTVHAEGVNSPSAAPDISANNPEASPIDHDRHINAFIQHALAYAPESEKKIWAQMREDLGI